MLKINKEASLKEDFFYCQLAPARGFTLTSSFREHHCLVKDIRAQQVVSGLDKSGSHGFLTGTEGHTGVVVLLVRLVGAIGVTDLRLKVVMVLGLVLTDTIPETVTKRERC